MRSFSWSSIVCCSSWLSYSIYQPNDIVGSSSSDWDLPIVWHSPQFVFDTVHRFDSAEFASSNWCYWFPSVTWNSSLSVLRFLDCRSPTTRGSREFQEPRPARMQYWPFVHSNVHWLLSVVHFLSLEREFQPDEPELRSRGIRYVPPRENEVVYRPIRDRN